MYCCLACFFFSSRRRHTRSLCDWSSDVCSSDLLTWAKRLTNQAFDLSFEEFLAEIDRAMDVVLGSEEHLAARRAWRERKGDRKSTRLNSSHTVISYAVFCLKKKKKQAHNVEIVT